MAAKFKKWRQNLKMAAKFKNGGKIKTIIAQALSHQ
jgi:hypothetical protein